MIDYDLPVFFLCFYKQDAQLLLLTASVTTSDTSTLSTAANSNCNPSYLSAIASVALYCITFETILMLNNIVA